LFEISSIDNPAPLKTPPSPRAFLTPEYAYSGLKFSNNSLGSARPGISPMIFLA
jgi:hypothetical protein